MKKIILSALCALGVATATAQVQNYALRFDPAGSVDCGSLPALDGRRSFIVQFRLNPTEWTPGATILSHGDGFKVAMGSDGALAFTVGTTTFSHSGIPTGEWSSVSIRVSEGGKVFINGSRKSGTADAVPVSTSDDRLTLGGGYKGLLDEVRIWGTDIGDEFNYFEHTTLNKWNPNLKDLLVYYKMDQDRCDNLVDYREIFAGSTSAYNNHGILSPTGVKREAVDIPGLPYLINGAYTANERFYDRSIPRDQYLLSNDLIILGIESMSDGHLRPATPNNHGTLNGDARWMKEYAGREGVMAFDGSGYLDCGTDIMRNDAPGMTFEAWVYVDEWVEGAYLFRKETDDATKGFSIRLGAESNREVVVRVDGNDYYNQRQMKAGQWIHVAIGAKGGSVPSQIFWWLYDGSREGAGSSKCSTETNIHPSGNESIHGRIGEGFKGKIDEFAIWGRTFTPAEASAHRKGLPMPYIGCNLTSDVMQKANTYLKFDDPDNPGWDSHSQDEWRRIMESAYEGHRGYSIRISVKSHNGWENTVANAAKRKIFAADLARLSEGYDGVELDLEWIYGIQTSLGLLSDEIRAVLPEGKSLMISCHNVAYQFPKDKMKNCEGFTFQQYGPQNTHSQYSHFVNMTQAFINYGFPKDKILCSYATTTSRGYQGGSPKTEIKGVKDGFMDGDFVPDGEVDFGDQGGYRYYFDGPLQTYKRARYVTDNRLGGIFYWDMGNDARPEHPYNLAKWCSYGLNANVDTLVTHVEVRHISTGIESIAADGAAATGAGLAYDPASRSVIATEAISGHTLTVYSLSGAVMAVEAVEGRRSAPLSLSRGYYVGVIRDAGGNVVAGGSFIVK